MIALFSPHYPDREFYTIVAIFMRLGYFATLDRHDTFDFGFAWQDSTWLDDQPILEAVAREKPVLNLGCRDISKRRVEAIFEAVFGYSTFIDPTQFEGVCVRKYDENARGGSVVKCPVVRREAGFVYQRLIDSSADGRMIEYRVPIICGDLPVVYVQEKVVPLDTIKTEKLGLHVAVADEVFSDDERLRIGVFCRRMGLDFGELDIVRANDDGQIYILDANKTPGGFGLLNRMKWQPQQRRFAIDRLAAAFEAGVVARLRAI
ncbi:MAG: hypothetical protein JNM75_08550 [Rhodospirillales bacterium]|nr:hypothetical protein [Rhodospirillales bacterium]